MKRRTVLLNDDVLIQAVQQYCISLSSIDDDEAVTDVTEVEDGMFLIVIEKD